MFTAAHDHTGDIMNTPVPHRGQATAPMPGEPGAGRAAPYSRRRGTPSRRLAVVAAAAITCALAAGCASTTRSAHAAAAASPRPPAATHRPVTSPSPAATAPAAAP